MNSVISALIYLRVTAIGNAIIARTKRLKQPKYLFGAIAGIAYLYLAVFRQLQLPRQSQSIVSAITPNNLGDLYFSSSVIVAASLCTLYVILNWAWPRARAALTFTEAEIAFLFPAPISRRALIHYRIINLAVGLLFTALIFSIFSSIGRFVSGNVIVRFIGWWLLLIILSLHSMAASFVITRLFDRGITSLRRQLTIIIGFLAVAIAFGLWTAQVIPITLSSKLVDISVIKNYAVILFKTAPLSWLLLPAKIAVAPMLANDWRSFLLSALPALLLLVLHYYWVLRSEVSFEEASIVKAEKRAAKLVAVRAGKRRMGSGAPKIKQPPFNLDAVRRPEWAFLWKNLFATASYLRFKLACYAFTIVIVGSYWINHGDHEVIRIAVLLFSSSFAGYVLFLGPLIARQDLRSDLLNADILKTYPLRGWQVVLGEILTPAVVLTTFFCILLLVASLCLPNHSVKWMTPAIQCGVTIAIAIVAALLLTIQLLVLNAFAIMFPAWTQIGQGSPGGVEVFGQRLLFIAGLLLIIIFSLLPAALFAVLFFFLTKWAVGVMIATTIATIIVIIILTIEIIFGLEWLGIKFEQFDLSAELKT